ncbi:hypothetical protein T484DRAFT_2652273 [Baffinella frigidus]|nr:hypothetical protein T484DRAFT_2652273 [Cryptophyta sp. CCMP2293]
MVEGNGAKKAHEERVGKTDAGSAANPEGCERSQEDQGRIRGKGGGGSMAEGDRKRQVRQAARRCHGPLRQIPHDGRDVGHDGPETNGGQRRQESQGAQRARARSHLQGAHIYLRGHPAHGARAVRDRARGDHQRRDDEVPQGGTLNPERQTLTPNP